MEIPDNQAIVPYSVGCESKTLIGDNGAANGILVTFFLDEGEGARTIKFFINSKTWLEFCIDNAAEIQVQYPELRQPHFVEVEWLERYTP